MTTQASQLLHMLDEDLYRLGNSTSPKLHNVRADDVNTYERNGIAMVVANGKGTPLITEARLKRIEKVATGYVWKLPANLPMPSGLALNPDMDSILKPGGLPEHFFLCPISDMTLSEYTGLLSKLALKLERTRKL